jgi:hypothetical protein
MHVPYQQIIRIYQYVSCLAVNPVRPRLRLDTLFGNQLEAPTAKYNSTTLFSIKKLKKNHKDLVGISLSVRRGSSQEI